MRIIIMIIIIIIIIIINTCTAERAASLDSCMAGVVCVWLHHCSAAEVVPAGTPPKAGSWAATKKTAREQDAPHTGDTMYLTVADDEGTMVSLIQSNYEGFGSGLVVPSLGFGLQDRCVKPG